MNWKNWDWVLIGLKAVIIFMAIPLIIFAFKMMINLYELAWNWKP